MKCSNPQRIFNVYLHRWLIVPCGKCQCCRSLHALGLKKRVENEIELHPYNIFATLTYRNDCVPCVQNVQGAHFIHRGQSDEILPYDTDFEVKKPVKHELSKASGWFGVLYYRDVQLFLKRLRKYVDKNCQEIESQNRRFRYFACCEYGENTNRPHYHIVFHALNRQVAEAIRQGVVACWSYCDWDAVAKRGYKGHDGLPSYCSSAAARYVSSYVCCANFRIDDGLPFREFFRFSRHPYYGISALEKKMRDEFFNGGENYVFDKKTYDGKRTFLANVSQSAMRYLLPRFNGIDKCTISELCQIFYRYVSWPVENAKRRFALQVRRIILRCFGRVTTASVFDTLTRLRSFYLRYITHNLKLEYEKITDVTHLNKKIAGGLVPFIRIAHGCNNSGTFGSLLGMPPVVCFPHVLLRVVVGFFEFFGYQYSENKLFLSTVNYYDDIRKEASDFLLQYSNLTLSKHFSKL